MSNMINRLKKRDVPPVKQVQLKLVRIDFWSAVRTGFTITVGLGIATLIGFLALWALVSFTPLFSSLNGLLTTVTGTASNITVSLPQVLGVGFALAIFNMGLSQAERQEIDINSENVVIYYPAKGEQNNGENGEK